MLIDRFPNHGVDTGEGYQGIFLLQLLRVGEVVSAKLLLSKLKNYAR
jgi:hypothetical protein